MRILYIYQFFSIGKTPEYLRGFHFSKVLAEKGNEVIVLATDFNRFSGESEGPLEELVPTAGKPIRVFRLPSSRKYRINLFYRFLNYAEFALRVLLKGTRIKDVDVILTSIPPLFVGPSGWILALLKRRPFFLEVQDLWPDALEVKGAVRGRIFLKPLYALANFLYHKSCFIGSVTYGIKEEIAKKGVDPSRIAVLPNGTDPKMCSEPKLKREEIREQRGWNDQFVVIYVGTLVKVTSMHTVIDAADRLRDVPRIRFEIFGSGSMEPELKKAIQDGHLKNICLNGTVAKKDVPSLLNAADACVMCLIETPLAHIYLQNKFFDYLGAGKPVLAAMRGHQREILERVGAGICVDPLDDEGLAGAALELAGNPKICRQMGKRGRAYAMKYFNLDEILDRYADLIAACAGGRIPKVSPSSEPPLPPLTLPKQEALPNGDAV